MTYRCLYLISLLICSIGANELSDQASLDDYSQAINNFDLPLNSSTSNQNVIDLLQSIQQQNATVTPSKNTTGLNVNSTISSSNIATLFNSYQYDAPVYQEPRTPKDQASQSTTHLDSSGTSQNFGYTGFDDNQKMYIEQQIEQDNKYMPEIFDLPPVPPQIIEPPVHSQSNQENTNQINTFDYGTKANVRPTSSRSNQQSSFKTPATVTRLTNKYSTKGTASSIKMANNQEWNVVDKNAQQNGYIHVHGGQAGNLKSTNNNYYQQSILEPEQSSFTSLDQQVDLGKTHKVKITGHQQTNYNRPVEGTQIITASNQASSSYPFQQQIISSNSYPLKQQSIAQSYGSSVLQQQPQQITYSRKPSCSKGQSNYESSRQRPFYFGWKQQNQKQQAFNQQSQKVNQAPVNYFPAQATYQASNYQAQQPNKQYFGLPNQFDQQSIGRIPVRKRCIVKLIPKQPSGFNQQSFMPSASMMSYYNPFQNSMTGVNGFVNKLENKKSKIKNLIKAPFVLVHEMKHKALGLNNRPHQSNFNPQNSYYPSSSNYIQQQNTFNKPYNQEYSY